MKTLALFALLFVLSPASTAHARALEGSLALEQEVRDAIRWEHRLCERGAFTSAEIDRGNHESEDSISERLLKSLGDCAALTERREARLRQGVLSASSFPLERDGSLNTQLALDLLDRSDYR